jgi:lysophospholipase
MIRTGYLRTSARVSIRWRRWPCAPGRRRGWAVILPGRFEFIEKFGETASALNDRGFDAFCLDWRGQGLSTRLLTDRQRGYVDDYADYVSDLAAFLNRVVAPTGGGLRILLTHSMGGHIVLRYLHRYPTAADRLVLVSPMVDVNTAPYPRWLARALARVAVAYGYDHAYVPGAGPYDLRRERFSDNRLTADFERFALSKREVVRNPALALGGVTHGWLDATFRSVDRLTAPGYTDPIRMPVLMVTAGSDRVVSLPAQQALCDRLADCRRIIIPGALHEILMETDPVRRAFWSAVDRFINGEAAGQGDG